MRKITTNRKSFIVHLDSLGVLDELTDEQAGQLFKAIKSYHMEEEIHVNQLIKIAFLSFKSQFDRDKEKYISICNRNKINGLRGGRPKNPSGLFKNPKNPSGLFKNPKNLDSDNDSDNDSDKKNTKKEILFEEFWNLYPRRVAKAKALKSYKFKEHDNIVRGVRRFIKYIHKNKTETKFIPHPVTWLNQGRWNDEYETIIHRSEADDIAREIINNRNQNANKGLPEITEQIDVYSNKGLEDAKKI